MLQGSVGAESFGGHRCTGGAAGWCARRSCPARCVHIHPRRCAAAEAGAASGCLCPLPLLLLSCRHCRSRLRMRLPACPVVQLSFSVSGVLAAPCADQRASLLRGSQHATPAAAAPSQRGPDIQHSACLPDCLPACMPAWPLLWEPCMLPFPVLHVHAVQWPCAKPRMLPCSAHLHATLQRIFSLFLSLHLAACLSPMSF